VRKGRLSAMLATVLVTVAPARADPPPGWLSGWRPVAPVDGRQSDPVIAADWAGGAYVVWQDGRAGADVFGQHLTATGTPATGWPPDGLPIFGGYVDPVVVADGLGGTFVAASNGRGVKVHHISADGAITPPLAAEPLHASGEDKEMPTILPFLIADGHGGAFMAWQQGTRYDTGVSVMRIGADGSEVWRAIVPNFYGNAPVICPDQADGVIVAWRSYDRVYATRFDGSGLRAPGWPDGPVLVCATTGAVDGLGIATDGSGGAIVVWRDPRSAPIQQIYAQRITSLGTPASGWLAAGQPVCTLASEAGLTRYPGAGVGPVRYGSVVPDGAGGALIAWSVSTKDGGDIYMQHLLPDASLAPGWPGNGLPLCAAAGSQLAPSLASDGAGGVFVTWQDSRSPDGVGVYAQHVRGDATLAPGWTVDGVSLCSAPLDHLIPRIAGDGAGGAIVAWQDLRCSPDVSQTFASHVGIDGTLPSASGIAAASAMPVSSRADSGSVRVVWHTVGAPPAPARVYCRQVDGPWVAVGNTIPDAEGTVIYADVDAIAGCRYGYALGLPACGIERIVGETWVDIPNGAGFQPLGVSSHAAHAASGVLQLDWELIAGEALTAIVLRRDACSEWTALDTVVTGDDGRVQIEDRGLYAGHTETYRIRVHACGQDYDLGELSTVIPQGQGFIPTTAALTHQEAGPGGVYLIWRQTSGPRSVAHVYRRDSTADWSLTAILDPDASGIIRCFDSAVAPGARYDYRLGLANCGAELFGDVVSIEVPDTAPRPRDLALNAASPTPARGELTILFSLPGSGPASLVLFDAGGRRLLAREVGSLGPGDHAMVLGDASTLRPGVYLVRLSQNGAERSMRVVFVR
jgi:hypothetical protein